MKLLLSFLAGCAACYLLGVWRYRKTNPGASIVEGMAHTLNTAWRPPK